MKKCITLITMLVIAGAASAALVEDFEGTTFAGTGNVKNDMVGWYGNGAGVHTVETSGGNPNSFVTSARALGWPDTFGIYLSVASLGLTVGDDYQIKFDYTVVGGSSTNNHIKVAVGEDNGSSADDSVIRNNGAAIQGNKLATFDIDSEVVVANSPSVGWTSYTSTGTFSVDALDNYVFIGFYSDELNSDNGEYIGIDNVTLVSGAPAAQRGSLFVIK